VHAIAEGLRSGNVQDVIVRLKRVRPKSPELRESLQALIRYYSENAGGMRYDEYLRRGYGIGSGLWRAPLSRSSMLVFAKPECAGAKREPVVCWPCASLLLLNESWALLDRLRMVSLA